ncbi:MAG: methyltransferase domain-containing protein [Bacteroidota bacterium]|nr:methyltransferase domain-containing protein [Bacteroidota bacterium]
MRFEQRSYTKELLDADDIPFADIRQNMLELNTINTWLGGHSITRKGFKKLASGKKEIIVCEIGCGGGDNLAAIVRWSQSNNILITCIGIDWKESCIEVARENPLFTAKDQWIVSDYAAVSFDRKPDIIFSSLFCHHFTEEQLLFQLAWMRDNSLLGFFINDLHRHWLAHDSIALLTSWFSSSYLVKHDAPLSVARGFVKKEWQQLCWKAGIRNPAISWQWAFRHLIIYQHAE